MLKVGYQSDKGISRQRNEDAYAILAEERLFLVADGVGGNNAGEIASRTAVEIVGEFLSINRLSQATEEDMCDLLDESLVHANQGVLDIGKKHPENLGMATTMVICHVREDKAHFLNVGDSRAYIFANDQLLQITEDHSYVNALIHMGVLSEEEAKHHKRGHVITKAVGADEEIAGDQYEVEIRNGDVILLCTDGLYGELSSEDIAEVMREEEDMQILIDRLVEKANEHGGRDNITAVAIKIVGGSQHE